MHVHVNRRALLTAVTAGVGAAITGRFSSVAQQIVSRNSPPATFSYPVGIPGRALGDGFFVRHGYVTENTWYNPGYWHTGEDWYALDGGSAGLNVYAVGDGEVVYAGSNYPGLVVIIEHAPDLYSMYGHLDPDVAVATGQQVARGDLVGAILRRGDWVPDHLHFEMRTFVTTTEVNGDAPRYAFGCGPNCPPGPGYWPQNAPDHPADQGWRNPTHVLNNRAFEQPGEQPLGNAIVAATEREEQPAPVWTAPPDRPGAERAGEVTLRPGDRLPLVAVHAGPEDTPELTAEAYDVWYQVEVGSGEVGWIQAAVPSRFETGSDGRPSTVRFALLPDVVTEG